MPKDLQKTAFLKECMADALLKLMDRTAIARITVLQITETAGVGRATWFRNFTSKAEALSFKLVSCWKQWAAESGLREPLRFLPEQAASFFRFTQSIRPILESIYRAGQQTAVYEAFCTLLAPKKDAGPEECYKSRFFANGLFALLDEWIKRGFRETPEEMAALLSRMLLRPGEMADCTQL